MKIKYELFLIQNIIINLIFTKHIVRQSFTRVLFQCRKWKKSFFFQYWNTNFFFTFIKLLNNFT